MKYLILEKHQKGQAVLEIRKGYLAYVNKPNTQFKQPKNSLILDEETYLNEVELRFMQGFIRAFGDLDMYAYQYSTEEKMQIYAPEMYI